MALNIGTRLGHYDVTALLGEGGRSRRHLLAMFASAVLLLPGGPSHAEQTDQRVLRIDPTGSQVTIAVGKAGLFGFAGHPHEVVAEAVSGRVRFDPEDPARSDFRLDIDAASLRVTGKNEPASDVPEVQRVMLSDEVLDVGRFPTISFVSREVTVEDTGPNTAALTIAGDLTLHGTVRRLIVGVSVELVGDGLLARGEFKLKQTDFGIRPPGAAGGLVKAKDELEISFSLRAGPDDSSWGTH